MCQQLDMIEHLVGDVYGPKDLKLELFGWDVSQEIAKAKARLGKLPHPTTKDFHKEVMRVFHSTRDFHVSVSFYGTEIAMLPLALVRTGEGTYCVSASYSQEQWDPHHLVNVGDEVKSIDGVSYSTYVEQRLKDIYSDDSPSSYALMAGYSTLYAAMIGDTVPQNVIDARSSLMVFERDGEEIALNVPWGYRKEQIVRTIDPPLACRNEAKAKEKTVKKRLVERLNLHQMHSPRVELLSRAVRQVEGSDTNLHAVGAEKSFVPFLGKLTWTAKKLSCNKNANICKDQNGKRVGYLRLSSYLGDESDFQEIQKILSFFQDNTDILILDEVNNPGGNAAFALGICSLLAHRPLLNPQEYIALNPTVVAAALETREFIDEVTRSGGVSSQETFFSFSLLEFLERYRQYNQHIIDEWKKGKSMTSMIGVMGFETIPSAKKPYTKPVIVLTNEISVSCADIVPAILQDNSRATIFGAQTAGAASEVRGMQMPENHYGIASYSLSFTHTVHADGREFENNGVIPDILCPLTKEDMTTDYAHYKKELQATVTRILSKK